MDPAMINDTDGSARTVYLFIADVTDADLHRMTC